VWPELLGRETPQVLSLPDVDLTGKEGSRVLRSPLQVERDRRLRTAKKVAVLTAAKRLACEVCTFDFFERYGELGKEFCEVHHLHPLASGGLRQTTLDDLAVVCSNCHRMMHRSDRVLSVEELRGYLKATPNHPAPGDAAPVALPDESERTRLGPRP
jgi:5-methylcytosine-specific restriction enzyme A